MCVLVSFSLPTNIFGLLTSVESLSWLYTRMEWVVYVYGRSLCDCSQHECSSRSSEKERANTKPTGYEEGWRIVHGQEKKHLVQKWSDVCPMPPSKKKISRLFSCKQKHWPIQTMGGDICLILHSCDSTESLTQGGPSFNNPTPPLLLPFAEIGCGEVTIWLYWELGGAWAGQSCWDRGEETEKTSARVWDNMPDRWSLPQHFVMECRTLERVRHVEQETVSAPGRLI